MHHSGDQACNTSTLGTLKIQILSEHMVRDVDFVTWLVSYTSNYLLKIVEGEMIEWANRKT